MPWVPMLVLHGLETRAAAGWEAATLAEIRWADKYEALAQVVAKLAERQNPEPAKLATRTRDQVIDAIIAKSGSNGQIRAHLSAWAAKQRREQIPDDKIIEDILVWGSPDEDEAP